MGVVYLMDSNILIDYTGGKFSGPIEKELDRILNSGFYFSIVSKLEVLGFDAPEPILNGLEEFLSTGTMFPLSEDIGDVCIKIRRMNRKIKLPDAIIAATSIVNNLVLLTSNLSDFKNVDGLEITSPELLARKVSDE